MKFKFRKFKISCYNWKNITLHTVYLLLGSNKGNRKRFLALAQHFIQQQAGIIMRASSVYKTEPWGNDNQPQFLNHELEIRRIQTPLQLLKTLKKIEIILCRVNNRVYSARTIDIDILFYDDITFHAKNLNIPHPRLHLRNFTLISMMELNKS